MVCDRRAIVTRGGFVHFDAERHRRCLDLLGNALFHVARSLTDFQQPLMRPGLNRIRIYARVGLGLGSKDFLNRRLRHYLHPLAGSCC